MYNRWRVVVTTPAYFSVKRRKVLNSFMISTWTPNNQVINAGEPWSSWGDCLRAVRAGALKEGLAMLWWRGVGRRARQECCARFQRGFGVQHRTSTDSPTSSLVVRGQQREAPSLRHHWREASRLMLTEHMFFKISERKSTQMWTHSESFLRPIFFLSFSPPPLLKNFFFLKE